MAEKLSVVMARRHLRMANVALLVLDATEGVLALDATIAGYAHEEGRALMLVREQMGRGERGQAEIPGRFSRSVEVSGLRGGRIRFGAASGRECGPCSR